MIIKRINQDRQKYLPLLLLADEQEDMIALYLDRGEMFALFDPDLRAVCIVTDEKDGVAELQNIAVDPAFQRRGYGKALVSFLLARCGGRYSAMVAGTGDSAMTIAFYLSCGFYESHREKNYFISRYDHPIFEAGKQLIDRVVFRKDFFPMP